MTILSQTYLDLDGRQTNPQQGRTFAAIRRSSMTAAAKHPPQPGKDIRAFQYHQAMHGHETPHSSCVRGHGYAVRHELAPDNTKRVRYVGSWEIPHWDFVPSVTEHHA